MGLSLELSEGADTSLLCFTDYVLFILVSIPFPSVMKVASGIKLSMLSNDCHYYNLVGIYLPKLI